MVRGDGRENPPPKGEGDHAQHGGGVSASANNRPTTRLDATLIPLHRFAVPLPFQGRN
jgi:hypothetical protein